jgi:hypothetical protein
LANGVFQTLVLLLHSGNVIVVARVLDLEIGDQLLLVSNLPLLICLFISKLLKLIDLSLEVPLSFVHLGPALADTVGQVSNLTLKVSIDFALRLLALPVGIQ